MILADCIRSFLSDLQVRNYSERTVEDYQQSLGTLSAFLESKSIQDPQAITTTTLTEFQSWLFYLPTKRGKARGVLDQNRIHAAMKSFFRFMKREGLIPRNPADEVEYAREPKQLPRNILTPGEAKKILDQVDISNTLGYRDRTLLEVLYSTGIRRDELRNLRLNDVNLEEETLRINQGKGGHDRVVPLTEVACRFLETFIHAIRPELAKAGSKDWLFLSKRGHQIDEHTANDIVKKHSLAAKIKKHVTCHVWRHTCATHLVKNNANLRHVQEILGHGSPATTERYLRVAITDLKEAHKKFHPREREPKRGGKS